MAYTPKQQKFYSAMWPLAQRAGAKTGIDPRLIFAQSALETGWGSSAPNNNYFGIKGAGGTQTTKEYINGAWVTIKDSFKGYSSMGDSVSGYVDFILSNKRYKPLLSASGIDAQLTALGKSGYATDPGYTKKLRSIINNIPSAERVATALGVSPDVVANVTRGAQDALGAAGVAQSIVTGDWRGALSEFVDGATGIVENNPVNDFVEWIKGVFSANTAARAVAIIAGLILVGVALVALAGADKVVVETAKTVAKTAAVVV